MNELSGEIRAALDAYRRDRSAENWTTLSQLSAGDGTVLDALQAIEPDFPDPLPVDVDGVIEDDRQFFQWQTLPDPENVERAIMR